MRETLCRRLVDRPAATQTRPNGGDRGETTRAPERCDTIVIGGGAAGLAVGYYLAEHHAYFVPELGDELRSAECPITGGSLNEHDEDAGAIGNGNARCAYGVNGMWEPDDPSAGAFQQWIRYVSVRLGPFSTGRNYFNAQTADKDHQRVRETCGANFDCLVAITKKCDPDSLFRVNRNIPPD